LTTQKQRTKTKFEIVGKTYLEIAKCSINNESTLNPPKIIITSIIFL
jgi:hypothetical protein